MCLTGGRRVHSKGTAVPAGLRQNSIWRRTPSAWCILHVYVKHLPVYVKSEASAEYTLSCVLNWPALRVWLADDRHSVPPRNASSRAIAECAGSRRRAAEYSFIIFFPAPHAPRGSWNAPVSCRPLAQVPAAQWLGGMAPEGLRRGRKPPPLGTKTAVSTAVVRAGRPWAQPVRADHECKLAGATKSGAGAGNMRRTLVGAPRVCTYSCVTDHWGPG
jgi:hypothetical protein